MRTIVTGTLSCAALAGVLVVSGPADAQQKSSKECNREWVANKATIQSSGKTKKAFIAECRGLAVTPEPGITMTLAAGQFATAAEAKASCPADAVVWANLPSKIYHGDDSKAYGKTKKGAYMCEKDSVAAGFRAPKTAKPKGV